MGVNNKRRVWIGKPSPRSMQRGEGWFREFNKVYVDQELNYCVMYSEIYAKEFGVGYHVCIRNKESIDIPWIEKQKIKNELFGEEALAIEVFPPESQLIDAANMYHLWVFKNVELSFGLHKY